MYKYIIRISCLIAIIIFSSCHKDQLRPEKYIMWVEDPANGLKVSEQKGNYLFELQYKPLQYIALRELGIDQVNKEAIEKEIENTKDIQYFTLRIATHGVKSNVLKYGNNNVEEYYARIQYFSFLMQNDLILVEEGEKLPCVLFHYERDYGISPYQTFLLGFPHSKNKTSSESDKKLIYYDKVLGVDQVSLTIKGKNVYKIPSLNI